MTSDKFGNLKVVSVHKGSKDHHRMAVCRCVCGGSRIVRVTKLQRGLVRECASCSIASARAAGRFNRRRLPRLEARIRESFGVYRLNARRKGLPFSITLDQFRGFATAVCAYCGEPPKPINGLDRVVNTMGYEVGNVTSCCSVCNYGKRDQQESEFLNWVKRVYLYRCAE